MNSKNELEIDDSVEETYTEKPKIKKPKAKKETDKICTAKISPLCQKVDTDGNFVGRCCRKCNSYKQSLRYSVNKMKLNSEKELLAEIEQNE
mgnify:CR=1 FL=1